MRLPCPDPQNPHAHHRTDLYGAFAFGCVILTCFMQFVVMNRIAGSPTQVALTFVLGSLYAALGILDDGIVLRFGMPWRNRIFAAMLTIVTVMLFVSPVRGFFAIIVLPLMSQAIFDYSPRRALLVGLYIYAVSISVLGYYYGIRAIPEAMISYLAAFAFTAAFTFITRRALDARDRETNLRAELEEANEKLRAYAAQAEELATTRERNRLAREIHDGVGHYLTVVKTQLDVAAAVCVTNPAQAKAHVEKAAKLSAEALEDVRRSVGSLRADASRPPLADAIKQLAAHGEPVPAVAIEGTPRTLPPAIEHALFRATQEGLTNIRKHARASSALVRLDFRDAARVHLELSDNGVGRNGDGAAHGGFGLTGLRERIELLGGTVAAANRLEGGFALRVEVPA
jgi:signal transduction histidine kinase